MMQQRTIVTRNWKWVIVSGVCVIVALAGGVWLGVRNSTVKVKEPITKGMVSTSLERMPDVDFSEPKPAAVIVPPIKAEPKQAAMPAALPPPTPVAPPAPEKRKPMISLFSTTTDDTGLAGEGSKQAENGTSSPPVGEYRPGMNDDVDKLPEAARDGLATQKSKWLASAGTQNQDFVTTPFLAPISKYMIQAGTIIQATAINSTNSDLPGDVVAMINYDIADTSTHSIMLIPAGARLYGTYNNQLSEFQSRVQIAWSRILYPDGSSQNIGAMNGTDVAGSAGIEADVNTHPWGMAGAVLGAAFFSVLGDLPAIINNGSNSGQSNVNVGTLALGAGGKQSESIGDKMITRQLNRPRTLTLPQGAQVAIMTSKDIALPPYSAHPWAR